MSKSLYGKYVEEREGQEIVESEYGFITYTIFALPAGGCYLFVHDIYVDKNNRFTGEAKRLVDRVLEIANDSECEFVVATIDPKTKTATEAMKFQIHMQMRITGVLDGMIYMKRELR